MPTFPVGVVLFPPPVQPVLRSIRLAEQVGLPMAWVPSWPVGPDALSVVTAAAVQTSRIGLGTGITITYPRHPLTLVNEALVMAELAPQRFRLGIGVSHQPAIEGVYGLDFAHPLACVREYITVLRGLLWEGRVACNGTYYRVHAQLSAGTAPPQIPIVLAVLRPPMLRLAGEVADGAMLIWATLSYVRTIALPAMEAGARRAHRRRPPLNCQRAHRAHDRLCDRPEEGAGGLGGLRLLASLSADVPRGRLSAHPGWAADRGVAP
jgi:alkanesulfonate monooxygenase SsuD/methylene tetrahydromethanopterin reductase-like flavin-dependent oxidoreductase (luciferase family)